MLATFGNRSHQRRLYSDSLAHIAPLLSNFSFKTKESHINFFKDIIHTFSSFLLVVKAANGLALLCGVKEGRGEQEAGMILGNNQGR